MYDSFFPKGVS